MWVVRMHTSLCVCVWAYMCEVGINTSLCVRVWACLREVGIHTSLLCLCMGLRAGIGHTCESFVFVYGPAWWKYAYIRILSTQKNKNINWVKPGVGNL